MTKENSNKIVELYPEMFTFIVRGYEYNIFEKGYNKALAYIHKHIKLTRSIDYIQQTNPYKYQFDIDNGWFKIVYDLVDSIRVNDEAKGKWVTKVTQCKEKFGGLRFYVTGTSDKNWDLIREAEKKSYGVCEVTGSEVEVGVWNDGWVQTICMKEALSKFAKMSDAGELKDGKTFNDYWAPREASVTIETPKKKRK